MADGPRHDDTKTRRPRRPGRAAEAR